MGEMIKRGAATLALVAVVVVPAEAKHSHSLRCASSTEVTAIAATSIQQQLMVAALTCNQISNFNAFQTNFGPELRDSDRALMHMFTRLYGARGASEYHGFKTRLANNSEIRSIHANSDFCTAASLVFAAALAPNKPALTDFVSGVQVDDPSPVNSCQIEVAAGLQGAMAAQKIVPRQKPSEFQGAVQSPTAPVPQAQAAAMPAQSPPPVQPASLVQPAQPVQPASTVASAAAPQNPTDGQADPQPKKKSGWLSGIFN